MLYQVDKYAYKFKLLKKWKIHDVFHMSLLEKSIEKKQKAKKLPKLNAINDRNKEYKVKAILDSTIYTNDLKLNHLPSFYYLVAWKGYFKEENT